MISSAIGESCYWNMLSWHSGQLKLLKNIKLCKNYCDYRKFQYSIITHCAMDMGARPAGAPQRVAHIYIYIYIYIAQPLHLIIFGAGAHYLVISLRRQPPVHLFSVSHQLSGRRDLIQRYI